MRKALNNLRGTLYQLNSEGVESIVDGLQSCTTREMVRKKMVILIIPDLLHGIKAPQERNKAKKMNKFLDLTHRLMYLLI
jgi:hypothetical protein